MKAPQLLLCLLAAVSSARALDQNANQQSDVWEMIFGASGLSANADADGDGWSNASESAAGTNPFDGASFPSLLLESQQGIALNFAWAGLEGKKYSLFTSLDLLGEWVPAVPSVIGQGATAHLQVSLGGGSQRFFRLNIADQDSDGDGINDWEERAIGFDPTRTHTERNAALDSARVSAGLVAANTISVSTYDKTCSERWPDPAVFVVRRSGGLQPLSVNVAFTGTATRGVDYTTSIPGTVVSFPAGVREVFVEINPIADSDDAEATETVVLTANAGAGYSVSAPSSDSVSILNETATSPPTAKAAARFLIQAAFGPDQDTTGDDIPENVATVMQQGFAGWIDDQFARPIGLLSPMQQWEAAQPGSMEIYNDTKQNAWWGRVMELRKLWPDATMKQEQDSDPLRQRVAFALSEIFVISDRMEALGSSPGGMVNFYDLLVTNALGNYRDLLLGVSLHPCMGLYLSHLGNRKADPVAHTFPDENYAREVMQLFSIGLWMLNPDGTRQLDGQGQPIATYSNANITEMARVFTGLSHGDNAQFNGYSAALNVPMVGFDSEHDLAPKTLLLGATTPARMIDPIHPGKATMDDVNAAIANLFDHPNVGPFLARQLIQRMVTSNPSPAYIGRVAAKFANNGAGVRGDMKAVVKQILLDPEARDPAMLADPTFGKLREPILKVVNFARAFNARSVEGWFYLDAFSLDHAQEPMKAPSVFNFFLPTYTPPGVLAQSGLVAPEFQLVNASSGVTAPNYFRNAVFNGLHRWGVANPNRAVKLTLTREMLLNVPAAAVNDPYPNVDPLDPDPLLRRLDLVLTGGTLTPRNFQIIREALQRLGRNSAYDWPHERLTLAIYLIVTSPEFAVQR